MIDLHAHSTFSDGTLTPEELAVAAREAGLFAMALTDHDCTDGVARFLAECKRGDVIGVPGVEISSDVPQGTMHILGYFMDLEDSALQDALREIRGGREDRNRKILQRLSDLGVPLTWEDVSGRAGEDVVGRPHFADAMIARGYARNKADAFDSYLAKGQPGYVDRFRLTPEQGLSVIRGAGGVPVLAHPFSLRLTGERLSECVEHLAASGLQGIEVLYPMHSPDQVRDYTALAKRHDLVVAGGTDFHGRVTPDVRLGRGFGSLHVPDTVVDELRARKTG